MNKKRKNQLLAIIAEARKELDEAEAAERGADHAQYVGRCFKYINSYSCPETEADKWPIYFHVINATAASIRVFRFETDKYGAVSIRAEDTYPSCVGGEITAAEYNAALDALKDKLLRRFRTVRATP